jgi:hypothetical protein
MEDRTHSGLYFDLYKYRCEYFRDLCIFDEASVGAGTTQLLMHWPRIP